MGKIRINWLEVIRVIIAAIAGGIGGGAALTM